MITKSDIIVEISGIQKNGNENDKEETTCGIIDSRFNRFDFIKSKEFFPLAFNHVSLTTAQLLQGRQSFHLPYNRINDGWIEGGRNTMCQTRMFIVNKYILSYSTLKTAAIQLP